MFQSEHLVEKWKPLLEHEGLDKIEDAHKRSVTAVLLENQEKFLRESASFQESGSLLAESGPTMSAGSNPPGFSGTATATGNVAGFDPVLISLIRRSMPNLVAYDLAGVQPMSGPTGLIFAMRSQYVGTGNDTGRTEAFYNEADSAFSGMGASFNNTSGLGNTAVGFGTTNQIGTNPSVLNPTATATATNYNVGQGMETDQAEKLGGTDEQQFNQMAFSIEKVTVTARSRALKAE